MADRDRMSGIVIALDGPSGSGKSTVGRYLANSRGLGYLDTGAMFRALAWFCHDRGVDREDLEAVADASQTFPLDITLEAADLEGLTRLEDVVARHLDRFAFREGELKYGWTRAWPA